MQPSKSIAILIRQAERLPEALRTGERLCRAGMRVTILMIGVCIQSRDEGGCEELARRLAMNADCYCCRPAQARHLGFNAASVPRMADKIAGADLVISF